MQPRFSFLLQPLPNMSCATTSCHPPNHISFSLLRLTADEVAVSHHNPSMLNNWRIVSLQGITPGATHPQFPNILSCCGGWHVQETSPGGGWRGGAGGRSRAGQRSQRLQTHLTRPVPPSGAALPRYRRQGTTDLEHVRGVSG